MKKKIETKKTVKSTQDNIKRLNVRVIGVQEGLENDKGIKKLIVIIIENLANLKKHINIQAQENIPHDILQSESQRLMTKNYQINKRK